MITAPEVNHATALHDVGDAEGYLAKICFKTGPPRLIGVELEWTVHDASDPTRPVDTDRLRRALGPHSPATLDPTSANAPLPRRGTISVEPGGQVEISTAPQRRVTALHESTNADIDHLTELLAAGGLVLGERGIDPYRPPRPLVDTPRYRAMRTAFDRRGPDGRTMMYSTAGLQVCLDAGEPADFAERWSAVHELGPPLLAAFANSGHHAGRPTGWASARMVAWQRIDPGRTGPVWTSSAGPRDPVEVFTAYALDAPVLCVRRDGGDWAVPSGVSFRDWIDGALAPPPTTDDLDYHLSTLFPPVRPRGYLEIRYLDGQPAGEWIAPVAVLAALLADDAALDLAREASAPVADRWTAAARHGLADPGLARAATAVLDAAGRALGRTGLPAATREDINTIVERRLAVVERGRP